MACHRQHCGHNYPIFSTLPTPQAPIPKPQAPSPEPQILSPKPQTLNRPSLSSTSQINRGVLPQPEEGGDNGGVGGVLEPVVSPMLKKITFCRTFTEVLKLDPRNPKPGTRNAKFESRNSKPETRNPKFETHDPKPETRNSKPETRNPKPETRNPKFETRNPKPEIRNPKFETRTRKQKPETLAPMPRRL